MIACPICKSTTVFLLRIDADWHSGLGDYYPVNERAEDLILWCTIAGAVVTCGESWTDWSGG